MNIFFYGGTFDPPHLGHEMIIKKLSPVCDKFIVLPAKQSPHKINKPISNASQRIEMLRLLFDNCRFEIDDYEIKSRNKSYTYLTINYLKKKYENSLITMIVGEDQLINLHKWKHFNQFIKNINIICFNRGLQSKNIKKYTLSENIQFIDDFNYPFSSSDIRKSLKKIKDNSLSDMLNMKVLNYIKENNLYV